MSTSVLASNPTPHARTVIVRAVAFPRPNALPPAPGSGAFASKRAFGCILPDGTLVPAAARMRCHGNGSPRDLVCALPVTLAPWETQRISLEPVRASGRAPFPLMRPPAIPSLVGLAFGADFGSARKVFFAGLELVEDLGALVVYRSRLHDAGTGIGAELLVEVGAAAGLVRWWLEWSWSDPSTRSPRGSIPDVHLFATGFDDLVVHHETQHTLARFRMPKLHAVHLAAAGPIADGQGGPALSGVLLTVPEPATSDMLSTMAAEQVAPVLVRAPADVLAAAQAYGPFAMSSPRPAWLASSSDALAFGDAWAKARYLEARERAPHESPLLGSGSRPAQTGGNRDFGALSGLEALLTDSCHVLLPLLRDQHLHLNRPTRFVELDGSPFTVANHPKSYHWSQRPFFSPDDNDTLGKEPDLSEDDTRRTAAGSPWWGWDDEHWSQNHLFVAAMLTADPGLTRDLERLAQSWIACHPLHSGNVTLDGIRVSRAIGRTFLSASWLILLLDDPALAAHAQNRLTRVVNAAERGPELVTCNVYWPEDASGALLVRHVRPWEENIAATGIGALAEVLGDAQALKLAEQVARSMVLSGWLLRADGTFQIGTAVAWNDGRALSLEQRNNPAMFKPADGTNYAGWSLHALLRATTTAIRNHDAPTLALCSALLAYVWQQSAHVPDDGGFPEVCRYAAMTPGMLVDASGRSIAALAAP